MLSKNFILQELVPPEIYHQFGEKAWQFLDPRLVSLADYVREFFNKPMTINNWDSGGTMTLRGFRPPATAIGGNLSQHKFGRAIDININDMSAQAVYKAIIDNKADFMAHNLSTVENINATPTWCHLDIRYTGITDLLIVNP